MQKTPFILCVFFKVFDEKISVLRFEKQMQKSKNI